MVKYCDLFITFFKIGTFTIGGGYAMIPLIQREEKCHASGMARQPLWGREGRKIRAATDF